MPYVITPPSERAISTTSLTHQHRAWWKEASVYQIYPASFKDSNNDGIGDLPGIISKMDYLQQLGVDVVWLSPILKSPQVDMGYDISDYEVIDPQYGHISDVDRLIEGLHARGMKLLMDLVVNHTSDQHEWFKKSRSSKDNEFREWYYWRKPVYDEQGNRHPPNNWGANFQGSAWEYDELTDEYYLHLFCPEQPDLNWEHPPVRDAVHKIIRFWLERGVDGFRMDVINFISKYPDLPNAPITDKSTPWQSGIDFYAAGPRLHEYLKDIGSILNEYNAFSVGEMPGVKDPKEVIKSVRHDRGELNMIFQFDIVDVDHGPGGKFSPKSWKLNKLKDIVEKWQTFMYTNGGWNALYIENHDQPRSVNRFACSCPKHRQLSSKLLATFLGCQAGTVFVYQGQELGMINMPKEWGMEEYRDIDCLNHWKLIKAKSPDAATLALTLAEYQKKSRDNARTPMQWSTQPHGGFTSASATPWMTANPSYSTINASSQTVDPASTFAYWSAMLAARKKYKDILIYGNFVLLGGGGGGTDENENKILAYERRADSGEKILVLCNFSPDTVGWRGGVGEVKEVVLSSYGRRTREEFGGAEEELRLEAYEACALLI